MAETNLLKLYETSGKLRVKEARDIPGLAVNYIDSKNTFQVGWSNFQELRKTTYTSAALNYYDEERKQIVIPESFRPADEGIALNRWGPSKGYYNPGKPLE